MTEQKDKLIILEAERIAHVHATDCYPSKGRHPKSDQSIHDDYDNNSSAKDKMPRLTITKRSANFLEFDLIGADASYANALRRLLIAEVPTMAIEHVYVMNNTSVIPDEIFSHRLGLVPIRADPRHFDFKRSEDEATDMNTLVFTLKVTCTKDTQQQQHQHTMNADGKRSGSASGSNNSSSRNANPSGTASISGPPARLLNSHIYSRHLEWIPQGCQAELFSAEQGNVIRPVHGDILLNKLRPGQSLDLELHAHKGIGREHAKWSPVATATYRLLPVIQLKEEISGEPAERLAKCFSPGVIELVPQKQASANSKNKSSSSSSSSGSHKDAPMVARVANPRLDTVSREVLRHADLTDKVELARVRDHFIFSVEGTGVMPVELIVGEALRVLVAKCQRLKSAIEEVECCQ